MLKETFQTYLLLFRSSQQYNFTLTQYQKSNVLLVNLFK